jgi:hypothetical protein
MWWPAAAWGAPAASTAASAAVPLPHITTTPGHLSPAPPTGAPALKLFEPTLRSSSVASAAPTVPTIAHSVLSQDYPAGNPYQDDIVGGNPTVAGTGTSMLSTPIIPLKIVESGGPTVSDASATASDCGQTNSAAGLTGLSPLFQNETPDPEGNQTQLIDAYLRGNFNQETKPGGISPNYHLLFSPRSVATQVVTVPAADVITSSTPCRDASVDADWWNANFPAIVANLVHAGVIVRTEMPLFVMYNTVLCSSVASNCAGGVAGGYHDYVNSTAISCKPHMCTYVPVAEVYGVYDYELSPVAFSQDTATMAHEVAEAVNDPFTNNPVPTWGHIGQVQTCQTNLEVGDPLSAGTAGAPALVQDTYTLNSVQYKFHVQDLAYHSWFFREASPPSSAHVANPPLGTGSYSMFGDLTTGSDPTVCPGQPTGVTAEPRAAAAAVSWTPGPGPVDQYYVRVYHNGTLVKTSSFAPPTTSGNILFLTNGQTYTFTVLAWTSAGGYSTESLPSNSVTAGTPRAPTGVTASAVAGGAKVSWNAPADSGSPITRYVVTPFLNGVAEAPDTFNSTATTETVTGLTNGQHYTFTVAATNANGTGLTSLQSNSVVPTAPK